ncbi:hypothetical protein S7711_04285 [Stachybotrys chartarum IBT 7711]|uniref:Frequency clock protein n=1 Tax=Stachybotrys chartarum (strain CBS 109288 / IBT 7711) TaxID=1280523 RepID=A0A084AJA9_STACB|nr:hypothetical protein S7711_04285 [Stachybotrys chartarum IBT 7711]KFA51134.1 hypothetical protein S40293_04751 [Stachybotrys chartarum IBT 40293]
MSEAPTQSQGAPQLSPTGHPLPRRAEPGKSVTLLHHRLARDASSRGGPAPAQAKNPDESSSPRRNSSGDSYDTTHSDPMKWFDRSNENPTATYNSAMDVDPPFFQKESDSSNEDVKPYPFPRQVAPGNLTAHSSSADDYRSVIDDLTVEIQKLKEELKRYKQKGPEMLRKDKLFEIKIHGLPKRKKRELESTLRDFAAGLEQSPNASSQRKKTSKHGTRDQMYSASGSNSKHASSSSGSNPRPVDSAYASMSTGANSSGTSLGRHSMSSRAKVSEQKVESYLRDIPEGLYPRHVALTEREKKKLVVRRLEQLFTGKIRGQGTRPPIQSPGTSASAILGPVAGKEQSQQRQSMVHRPPPLAGAAGTTPGGPPGVPPTAAPNVTIAEAAREARFLPSEQNVTGTKKTQSREDGSASHSNGEQTESGDRGNTSGSGTTSSPTDPNVPEQRPTRPKDLDPDRVQIPSENMDYIRHLGLVPPELLAESRSSMQDVHPDADGWVYLNLLCNLAQLHIINVTPDFVRSAVADWSTKFQVAPDGRKIRWRGGSEGTKFSSDDSGHNSQRSPETEEEDPYSKEDLRKRQKKDHSAGDDFQSGTSSGKNASKFGPQISSEDSFHYKPMFVHHESSGGQTSMDDTLSSFGPIDEDNGEDSRWGLSGSGNTSSRRKRRHDGAIIYYSGAPFCTDLSGDPGDVSPATYMMSNGQEQRTPPAQDAPPPLIRTDSGAITLSRPLSERIIDFSGEDAKMEIDNVPGLSADSDDDDSSDAEWDFPWSSQEQVNQVHCLEPSGLGGVLPEDHFTVIVSTKRRKFGRRSSVPSMQWPRSDEITDSIVGRLAGMTTSSPAPPPSRSSSRTRNTFIEIDYLSGRIKRLAPNPLPPPLIYFHPFSTESSWNDDDVESADDESGNDENRATSTGQLMSRQANPYQSDDYPDGLDLSSGDEDGEDPDDEPDSRRMYDKRNSSDRLPRRGQRIVRPLSRVEKSDSESPAATAGGVESGYSSSGETS